jgi:hypothetical protein
MKLVQAGAEIRAVPSGRWKWTSGASVSSRHFSNEFARGVQLKYSGSVTRTLVREPSKQLSVDSSLSIEAGKLFGATPIRFAKLANATSLQWKSVSSQVRMGSDIGRLPFDERFIIGLERDSDLWMRAHSATVDGCKNASSTSRSFLLTNSDYQKVLSNTGWFRLSAGPFLDSSKSSISSRWLVDTGVELRFNLLGAFEMNLSYGKSLTDGRHALFLREHRL